MQEKIATARRHTSKEERRAHADNWKKSGLSMTEYCRQNNLTVANPLVSGKFSIASQHTV